MKRPSRAPNNLSQSLQRRLNSYALMASAGVSIAAFAPLKHYGKTYG
jgi:hypothetical protein